MALETAIRLVCDHCRMPSESLDGSPDNRMAAMAEFSALGWVSHGASHFGFAGDICPACIAATHDAMKKGAA